MDVRYVDIEQARSIRGGVAVAVDVMRAYTVAAWAFARGATEIVLVDDVEEAVAIAERSPGALLFKDGAPDDRFDLHNSPRQLLDLDVAGRRIVQRTTAGTRAAVAATGADHLFCTGLVSAIATAEAVAALRPDAVTFVVSGGLDADEDLACAELIAAGAQGVAHDPASFVERARTSTTADALRHGVDIGYTGVTDEDVPMCLELDRFDFAMHARTTGVELVLRPVATPAEPARAEPQGTG